MREAVGMAMLSFPEMEGTEMMEEEVNEGVERFWTG